ncbi:hypothetical protein QE152_g10496 [Popillia japonica]|uniref:Uncharacterized protein n=1 Tax=Popillia japonica TaxID=7064 RepID=A0AAW1LTM7_POPJA
MALPVVIDHKWYIVLELSLDIAQRRRPLLLITSVSSTRLKKVIDSGSPCLRPSFTGNNNEPFQSLGSDYKPSDEDRPSSSDSHAQVMVELVAIEDNGETCAKRGRKRRKLLAK